VAIGKASNALYTLDIHGNVYVDQTMYANTYIFTQSMNNTFDWTSDTGGGSTGYIWFSNSSVGIMKLLDTGDLNVFGAVNASSGAQTSDSRLKQNHSMITDATTTLLKLQPTIYNKHSFLKTDPSGNFEMTDTYIVESGLIAQDVFTYAHELRHLVTIAQDADPSIYTSNAPNDAQFGSTPSYLNYIGLIPYLIQGFQEQQSTIHELCRYIRKRR
jgi:hypothetical protein